MRPVRAYVCCSLVLAACDSSPRPPTPGVDDAERGRRIIGEADCGACHTIPGVRGARGVVAAPLTAFARRSFIAGEVPNTRENLVRWIRDPRSIEPGTAMPALGLDEGQARDVAAYLDQLR